VQPFTPRAMPETPRAAKERAAVVEHLRQVSADSVSSASLPINGVHRVLKVGTRLLSDATDHKFDCCSHIILTSSYVAQWQWFSAARPADLVQHVSFLQLLCFYDLII